MEAYAQRSCLGLAYGVPLIGRLAADVGLDCTERTLALFARDWRVGCGLLKCQRTSAVLVPQQAASINRSWDRSYNPLNPL
jgi:hypothetical protein